MKAIIFINGAEVFSSNRISAKNLEKKVMELKRAYGCMKIEEQIKKRPPFRGWGENKQLNYSTMKTNTKHRDEAIALLSKIEQFCGFSMQLANDFVAFRRRQGCKTFDVIISEGLRYNSPVWGIADRLTSVGIIEKVAENGFNRLLIYFK